MLRGEASQLENKMATAPVTNCSAERSFSGLKEKPHSDLLWQTLDWLDLRYFMYTDIKVEAAVDEFARMHPRKMKTTEMLAEDTNYKHVS